MFTRLRSRRAGLAYGAAAAAVMIGGSLLGAAPAQAAPPAQPYGTVVTPSGVNERQYPSTDSSVKGTLAYRAQVGLTCKVRAQNIDGNTVWYLLRDEETWVTARYVDNTGYVDYCKNVMPSALTQSKEARTAKG
ncbi:MAG TPA: hypothetical protein DEQ61_18690 [Streptomyces sp.]|nr:hypothetical protein [Streptomyces sp.]